MKELFRSACGPVYSNQIDEAKGKAHQSLASFFAPLRPCVSVRPFTVEANTYLIRRLPEFRGFANKYISHIGHIAYIESLAVIASQMQIITKPIGLFGIFWFLTGLVLNINMYLEKAWPTIMFFVLMLIGIVYMLIAWKTKLNSKAQIVIGLLPVAGYWVLKINYLAM